MLFAGVCTGQRHLCLYLCVLTGSIRIVDVSYRIWTLDRCEWRSKKRNHAWSATGVPLRDMAEVSNFCRIHRLTDRKSIKELFAYYIFTMLSGLVQRLRLCMYVCMYVPIHATSVQPKLSIVSSHWEPCSELRFDPVCWSSFLVAILLMLVGCSGEFQLH
jgi:hypothetical protein